MSWSMKKCTFSFGLPCRSKSLNVPAHACARFHNRWTWGRSSCRWALVDLNANLAKDRCRSAFKEACHMFSLTSQKCHAAFSQNFHPPCVHSHRRACVNTTCKISVTPGKLKELLNAGRVQISRMKTECTWNNLWGLQSKSSTLAWKVPIRAFSFFFWHGWLWGSKHFPRCHTHLV